MKICTHCKHSSITLIPGTPACFIECKKHIIINPIDGFKRYAECEKFNKDGKCSDYKESWFRKLINKF